MEILNESTSAEQRFFPYPCSSKSGKYIRYFSAFGTFDW